MNYLNGLKSIPRVLWGSKKNIIISLTLLIIISITTFLCTKNQFGDFIQVKNSARLIPSDVKYYVEIINPKVLSKTVKQSLIGKKISESKHWNNLFNTPEIQKLYNILYLLEVKTGIIITAEKLPDYFDGPLSFAKSKNDSVLINAKTNLKSKLGVSLLTIFAGEDVEIKKDIKRETNSSKKNKKNVNELYNEKDLKLDDLRVSKLSLQNYTVYITLAGDYLFISDNLEMLKSSLLLASSESDDSMLKQKGMENIYKNVNNSSIVLYFNNSDSYIAPLMQSMSTGSGIGLLFDVNKDVTLSANIYDINSKHQEKEDPGAVIKWNEKIDQSSVATLYSNKVGLYELLSSLENLDNKWSGFKSGVNGLMKRSNLKDVNFFEKNSGFILSLNSMDLSNKMIYPNFSIGFNSSKDKDSLAKAIFKTRRSQTKSFQGKKYYSYVTKSDTYYKPALIDSKEYKILSSHVKNTMQIISAQNGNKPVLDDLKSYKKLNDFKSSPHHLIININQLYNSIKNFYYYGAKKTGDYSDATINKDILPLYNVFKDYKTIHIAYGSKGDQSGKIVISGK